MVRSRVFSRRRAAPAALLLALVGCTASSDEVRPPADELFFPTGVVVSPDPDQTILFVANANADLRYDSGTVAAIDLAAVDAAIQQWVTSRAHGADCEPDRDFSETLVCRASAFIIPGGSVRTGNFATGIAAQDLGNGNVRLVVPVRGDPSVTWVDWDAAGRALRCSDSQGFAECDDPHRLTQLRDDGDLPDIDLEPFGVYADSAGEFAIVTHLAAGAVTLVDSPKAGTPVLADALDGLFGGSGDLIGSVSAAAHPAVPGLVYVPGRTEPRVAMLAIDRRAGEPRPALVPTDSFTLLGIGTSVSNSSDSRGIAFDPTGEQMFIINREPPLLHVYDTALGRSGAPNNRVTGGTDLCLQSSSIVVGEAGDGVRAFVTCFSDGEVWIVDPRGGAAVEAFVQTGRGAYGVALSSKRQRLYVSNHLDDTVSVVDLNPSAATRNRVVLRIGEPRQ